MTKRIRYVGSADFKVLSTSDFASFGLTGVPSMSFDKADNFEADVSDDVAVFLLAQGGFEEETGLDFSSALSALSGLSSLSVSGPHIAGSLPTDLSIIPNTIGNTEMDPTDPIDRSNKISAVETPNYVGAAGKAGWYGSPNWSNYDATETTFFKVAYWLDPLTQMVHLRGLAKLLVPSGNQTIFTLPPGYRPLKTLNLPGFAQDVSAATQIRGAYQINAAGAVAPSFGLEINDLAYLDGMSFRVGS
jgi:hypothetical protein